MKAFTIETGLIAPLNRSNVDTDAIIPKQFLKSIKRSGFGVNLFDEWRYLDEGQPHADNSQRPKNPDFVLNNPLYQAATILLARENFGCGSSREHAVWALEDYGFRAVIAPSFADIFYNNCFKNGVLPIVLPFDVVESLFALSDGTAVKATIDLAKQTVCVENEVYPFDIDSFRKDCLLKGLDAIGLTLQYADEIKAFEADYRKACPWIFASNPQN
ncbi:3-isopropylmalate dehydratase small subunit [Ostreibacterium oceani]|uniref:3-isopropylmalate dehydratase small subunit n=1 Tax=Ostreibacterium oceani TaxID=2654998 RepID=A0A6N7F068_9GAMM|nr:3-isopropylmalate dehydratase small subunit [Ostreibacterium oceani]MPV86797.1 3-isopropylmalate dehydratase small subunit [Ostreibacterium oceani]